MQQFQAEDATQPVACSSGVSFPRSCKLSDPFRSDSRWARGGWDTVVVPVNTINSARAPQKSTYSKGGRARVKKTPAPAQGIAFLYLNAKCYETKWLAQLASVTTSTLFSCWAEPRAKHVAIAMVKNRGAEGILVVKRVLIGDVHKPKASELKAAAAVDRWIR